METNTHQSVGNTGGTAGPGLPGGPVNPFKRSVSTAICVRWVRHVTQQFYTIFRWNSRNAL